MIQFVEDYIEKLDPEATFGQLQDEPSRLLNCAVTKNTVNNYYSSDTVLINISVFMRDDSYQDVRTRHSEFMEKLLNSYALDVGDCRIVDTRLVQELEPNRDIKNRYTMYSNYTMLIYKKEK